MFFIQRANLLDLVIFIELVFRWIKIGLAKTGFYVKTPPSTYLMGTDILVLRGKVYAGSYHDC